PRTCPSVLSNTPIFPSPDPHLNPPSFPTRRSSDLRAIAVAVPPVTELRARLDRFKARVLASSLADVTVTLAHEDGTPMLQLYSRSEEHTSELQSLAYLVCRLLLEKKKIINEVDY